MKKIYTLAMMAAFSCGVFAQKAPEHNYTVSLDTVGKYINVKLDYTSAKKSKEVLLKMPVWAPGYYEIQDFPKHLCDFAAKDVAGNPIKWTKTGKNGWRITMPANGKAVLTYRIFADIYDVASSRIDSKSAFIAPNGVFMYAEGEKMKPVTVTYDVPTNWNSVSTGLVAQPEKPHTFTAPNFDVLYDSPILMGNHLVRKFKHEGHDYEMALETPDGYEESGFEDCFRKIVSAATDIMKDVPYDNYTLIHLGKGRGGLEHLNSQACYTDGTFRYDKRTDWLNYLSFTAHEYFHLYNVKTIRPIELGPFDYDREALTPLLWFSEGITCYYEAKLLYNAGIATQDEMYDLISKYMQMDERYDGHHHQSLRMASYDIWLNFMNEDANSHDVRINYYFRGPVVGLIMDCEIQRLSNGKRSLDDLMRLLYNRYHKQKGRGFTEEEFWSAVDEVAGASMADVRYIVDNPVDIDYEKFLTPAGIILDRNTWSLSPAKSTTSYNPPSGKQIFIPRDLKDNDFTRSDSKWSYARMAYTDDVIVFWDKAFGKDLSKAPDLEGQNMKVDIDNLLSRLQSYYDYFKNRLKFIKPGSKADKYRMMVMLNYTLEGTAYGGDYDGQIGALWISPNRVQDKKLNCIAHELGHSFQSQIGCDGEGESWGGGGIFEMASQWMLWQVNPEWTTDENYHWKGFIANHNRRFLDIENIYHSPYVLEYWAMKHGETEIADLFRAGKKGEDPASTYMRIHNLTLDEMNNEMADCYSRLLTFDFPRVRDSHRKFVGEMTTPMTTSGEKSKAISMQPAEGKVPETWGFNIIDLSNTTSKASASLKLKGTGDGTNRTFKVRWITVRDGEPTYGPVMTGRNISMKVPMVEGAKSYLLVVACPEKTYSPYTFNPYEHDKAVAEVQFPYELTIR